ncbi:tyrosyl-trna synthetase [Moesziomyces antarcticus T-34]|uniref:Tyrosine--tRNA ligase n=1 Tax=Pseudozyma antarctica (strain T-34) TaxID=1151754 RepID=M9LIZ2_PSEA3|nr:tyrosyl-trna synthetase [Moesziomyces antarcticus T-34]
MLARVVRRTLASRRGLRGYSTVAGDVVGELETRGLVHTLTSRALRTHLSSPRTVYSGVDPSARSLHVGNLLPLLALAHFARYGHRPIVLVGGATGSIGDPSGRSSERNALDPDTLSANVAAIQTQLKTFFANVAQLSGKEVGVRMLNNYTWMSGVSMLDFLGEVGRHARLTQMLARESVASRMEGEGMSYTEFSYQLLQAYDFAHLHRTSGCTVQLGGSDQLGNISAGIDLIRRRMGAKAMRDEPAYGLTLPLLTTASGEKFGKSAGNAVWLDAELTSHLDFFQFFLRTPDADVPRYLNALTLLSSEEIGAVLEEYDADRSKRTAQRVLADHMTRLIRGAQAAKTASTLTAILAATPDDVPQLLSQLDLHSAASMVVRLQHEQPMELTRIAAQTGLVKSRAEAKRLLNARGLYVNNAPAGEGWQERMVPMKHGGKAAVIRAGKSALRIVYIA